MVGQDEGKINVEDVEFKNEFEPLNNFFENKSRSSQLTKDYQLYIERLEDVKSKLAQVKTYINLKGPIKFKNEKPYSTKDQDSYFRCLYL